MLIFSLICGDPFWGRFVGSGSLAMFTAIRRASSRLSELAAARRPGRNRTNASACPLLSRTMAGSGDLIHVTWFITTVSTDLASR
jgi:hypothetical protein